MSTNAFKVVGATQRIIANTSPPDATKCSGCSTIAATSYRVANPEANETIFYTCADNGVTAKAQANLSAALPWIPLPAGAVEVISGPSNAYFSAVTRSAAANLYITPGDGM